jgi:transcriptional/translational regulatory protein YebC/TACO1
MADAGSVLFNFERRGEIAVADVTEDKALELAMDAGAEDVEPYLDDDGNQAGFKIISTVENFGRARDSVSSAGFRLESELTGLAFKPLATVKLEDEEQFRENVQIYERCLELDDVDAIHTTCAHVGRNK